MDSTGKEKWVAVVAAIVCSSCQPTHESHIQLRVGMALAELNEQLAKTGPRSSPAKPNDWLGVNGPLKLDIELSGGVLHVPVSEHGGLQLTTSSDSSHLNFIQADVAPQPLDAADARHLAMRLCIEAAKVGLAMQSDAASFRNYQREGSRDVCSAQDHTQHMGAWIDRFQLEENGKYRVLLDVTEVDRH